MKESLKTKLHNAIKQQGSLTYYEVEKLCHQWGYKVETASRQLRQSQSPQVRSVMKNGAVVRYEWKERAVTDGYTAKQFFKDFPPRVKEVQPAGLF